MISGQTSMPPFLLYTSRTSKTTNPMTTLVTFSYIFALFITINHQYRVISLRKYLVCIFRRHEAIEKRERDTSFSMNRKMFMRLLLQDINSICFHLLTKTSETIGCVGYHFSSFLFCYPWRNKTKKKREKKTSSIERRTDNWSGVVWA